MRQLESFIQSLAQSLSGMTMNQNMPMSDSGIYPQGSIQSNSELININNNQSGLMSRFDLNSTAYFLILLAAVLFLLSTLRKGSSKKKEENIKDRRSK
jgi:hypothetical protein